MRVYSRMPCQNFAKLSATVRIRIIAVTCSVFNVLGCSANVRRAGSMPCGSTGHGGLAGGHGSSFSAAHFARCFARHASAAST